MNMSGEAASIIELERAIQEFYSDAELAREAAEAYGALAEIEKKLDEEEAVVLGLVEQAEPGYVEKVKARLEALANFFDN